MAEQTTAYSEYSLRQTPSVLQLLVWEAAPLRLLLELFTTLLIYYSIILNLPDIYKQNTIVNMALGMCLIVITIYVDRNLLCRSQDYLKKSFDSAISGELNNACGYLENVLTNTIPPPAHVYNARAAELYFMKGESKKAEHHLDQARELGIRSFECELIKLKGMLYAESVLDKETPDENLFAAQPLWMVERAMLSLFKGNDYGSARKHLEAVKLLPSVMHSSSASTHDLSHLINLCMGLHLGKADESLSQLNFLLSFIKYQISTIPEIRPILSFAYLERAKYYSKRSKNWSKARNDIDVALSICRYPAHMQIAKSISEKIV